MAAEIGSSGMQMSISDMRNIASQLESTAGAIQGHADALAGAAVPAVAFGAHVEIGAQLESTRAELATIVGGHAQRVFGHSSTVRGAYTSGAGADAFGAATARATGAELRP